MMRLEFSPRQSYRPLIVFLMLLTGWVSCTREPVAPPQRPAAPVTAGVVSRRTAPVQLRAIGNGEAYNTVMVKSLVGGELMKVHFQVSSF